MDSDDDRLPEISLAGDNLTEPDLTIPCESVECQLETDLGTHNADWIVRFECCSDTEAWCTKRFRTQALRGLFHGSTGSRGYLCMSCGQRAYVHSWMPIRDLGRSPGTQKVY